METLWINKNRLSKLPKSFSNLTNLKTLYANNNEITTFPDLNNLKKLALLHLSSNNVVEIDNIQFTESQLQNLDVRRNPLSRKTRDYLEKHSRSNLTIRF